MAKLSDIIRSKRTDMGLTQKAFGNLFGAQQTTVSDWEKGKISMMRNWQKLAGSLGLRESEFLDLMAEATTESEKTERMIPALRQATSPVINSGSIIAAPKPPSGERDVPVLGRSKGGSDGEFEFNGQVMGWEWRPPHLAGVVEAYATYVDGESMYPRYKPGETVWTNPPKPIARGDDIIVQLAPNEEDGIPRGFIKEFVRWEPSFLVVCQFNPPMEIKYPRDDVVSIHKIDYAQK
jgi:phage repressor protein C with HTH and peptisase S24 domain